MFHRVAVLGCCLILYSCGQKLENSESELNFKLSGAYTAGLVWKAHQEMIRVCYQDPTNSQRHMNDIADSIVAWLAAIEDVSDKPVSEEIQFVAPNASCDVIVHIGDYSPAFTRMSRKPNVYLNHSGWFGSTSVILHEFGHAFGLLDTYVGSGGRCQEGQPSSVMCTAKYADLQSDDVRGVQAMYRMVKTGKLKQAPENFERLVY